MICSNFDYRLKLGCDYQRVHVLPLNAKLTALFQQKHFEDTLDRYTWLISIRDETAILQSIPWPLIVCKRTGTKVGHIYTQKMKKQRTVGMDTEDCTARRIWKVCLQHRSGFQHQVEGQKNHSLPQLRTGLHVLENRWKPTVAELTSGILSWIHWARRSRWYQPTEMKQWKASKNVAAWETILFNRKLTQ